MRIRIQKCQDFKDPAGSGFTRLGKEGWLSDCRKAALLDRLEDERRRAEKLSGSEQEITGLQAALR